MNVREYFEQAFPAHPMLDRLHPNGEPDDTDTFGSILAEMPLESNCGDDCKDCIDAAIAMHGQITNAFGLDLPKLLDNTIYAALRVCSCYIRG